MEKLEERFCKLATDLVSLCKHSKLAYTKIRETILRLDRFSPEHLYAPNASLGVALGDIGYIQGGEFIKLDSLRAAFGKTCHLADYKTASGAMESSEQSADGVIV